MLLFLFFWFRFSISFFSLLTVCSGGASGTLNSSTTTLSVSSASVSALNFSSTALDNGNDVEGYFCLVRCFFWVVTYIAIVALLEWTSVDGRFHDATRLENASNIVGACSNFIFVLTCINIADAKLMSRCFRFGLSACHSVWSFKKVAYSWVFILKFRLTCFHRRYI